ncbi:Snf7-domain-containing protein [Ochromonadaceae sp. CCMP2298]|nr:Snf7-domain-containing protein [Ochromonadaceae sp. CCMP2298]
MGNLFGGGTKKKSERAHKDDQVTDKDRAILDLKNARDRLKKYRKRLEKDSKDLEEKARELIRAKQKNRALLVLKLRRFKDEEATKIEGELLSVYEMIENVEWEHANMDVLKALKAGNVSLNKLHQEMSADDVAELLEETNEAIEVENSINAMLAGQFDVNDEELERELAELMGEMPVLPAAPTTDIDFEAAAQRAEKHDAVLA